MTYISHKKKKKKMNQLKYFQSTEKFLMKVDIYLFAFN